MMNCFDFVRNCFEHSPSSIESNDGNVVLNNANDNGDNSDYGIEYDRRQGNSSITRSARLVPTPDQLPRQLLSAVGSHVSCVNTGVSHSSIHHECDPDTDGRGSITSPYSSSYNASHPPLPDENLSSKKKGQKILRSLVTLGRTAKSTFTNDASDGCSSVATYEPVPPLPLLSDDNAGAEAQDNVIISEATDELKREVLTYDCTQKSLSLRLHSSEEIFLDQSTIGKDTPSISLDEFVMPGSDLQNAMALSMKDEIHQEPGDECVICMDGFTTENPRMPTLCKCGENKTYFHLPCLYQWIEKSKNCPSCAERITWQELGSFEAA